jgi:hypothetical protein
MRPKPSDYLRLGLSLSGYAIAIVGFALLLNFPAECAPEITNCGEGRRQASFVVLALGITWLGYLIARFVRDPKNF